MAPVYTWLLQLGQFFVAGMLDDGFERHRHLQLSEIKG